MLPIRVGIASKLLQFDEIAKVARAINVQVSRDLGQIWGIQATVEAIEKPDRVPTGVWPIFIVDNLPPDEGGVHKTDHNQPYALVENGPTWSLSASHECLEMLVDPSGNRLVASSAIGVIDNEVHEVAGKFEYLVEVCDPSEAPENAYLIDDVMVSDFYTPHYFDPVYSHAVRYSFTGKITRPRQVLPDGYLSWYNPTTRTLQQLICSGAPYIRDIGPASGMTSMSSKSLRELVDSSIQIPLRLSHINPSNPTVAWAHKRSRQLALASRDRTREYQEHWSGLYAAVTSKPKGSPRAAIKNHTSDFKINGVISIRSGYLVVQGQVTDQEAIVVTARPGTEDKVRKALGSEKYGWPVDVRTASAMQELRMDAPEQYAALSEAKHELRVPEFDDEIFVNAPKHASALADALESARKPPKPAVTPRPPSGPPPGVTLNAVQEEVSLLLHISPEQGWVNLQKFLQGVEQVQGPFVVGLYDCTSKHIVDQVIESVAQKPFILTLDHPAPNPSRDKGQFDEVTMDEFKKAIPQMQSAWALTRNDPKAAEWIYPEAYHIKVAVRNDDTFWLSSGNWNNSNQPEIDLTNQAAALAEFKKRDRDWHVIAKSPTLSNVFRQFLLRDYQLANQYDVRANPLAMEVATADALDVALSDELLAAASPSLKPKQFFDPITVTGNIKIQPLLTPDFYQGHILELIQSAKQKFYMQTQYIHPSTKPDDKLHQDLIDAIEQKVKEGVDVRLIVSEWEDTDWVEKVAQDHKLVRSVMRRQNGVHNKGIVVDGEAMVISSQNWSPDGTLRNRDAGLIIWSTDAASYFEKIFIHDWENLTYTTFLPPRKKKSASKSQAATPAGSKSSGAKSSAAKKAPAPASKVAPARKPARRSPAAKRAKKS